MKAFGIIEIFIGIFLLTCSSWLMLRSVIWPESDPHGYMLMVLIFGASIGCLLSFSGAFLLSNYPYKFLAHIPLVDYSGVAYFTWVNVYA